MICLEAVYTTRLGAYGAERYGHGIGRFCIYIYLCILWGHGRRGGRAWNIDLDPRSSRCFFHLGLPASSLLYSLIGRRDFFLALYIGEDGGTGIWGMGEGRPNGSMEYVYEMADILVSFWIVFL